MAEVVRRSPGRRLPATGTLVEVLVPTILEQKVTGLEAWEAFRALAWRLRRGGPRPRPPPGPARPRTAWPSWATPTSTRSGSSDAGPRSSCGSCRRAGRFEGLLGSSPTAARAALEQVPGIGAWTSTSTVLLAFGDPDAVVVGDFHLPHLVTSALTGRRRGSDAEMLELLAPYVGQRARAQGILAGLGHQPRRAPRLAPRRFADS